MQKNKKILPALLMAFVMTSTAQYGMQADDTSSAHRSMPHHVQIPQESLKQNIEKLISFSKKLEDYAKFREDKKYYYNKVNDHFKLLLARFCEYTMSLQNLQERASAAGVESNAINDVRRAMGDLTSVQMPMEQHMALLDHIEPYGRWRMRFNSIKELLTDAQNTIEKYSNAIDKNKDDLMNTEKECAHINSRIVSKIQKREQDIQKEQLALRGADCLLEQWVIVESVYREKLAKYKALVLQAEQQKKEEALRQAEEAQRLQAEEDAKSAKWKKKVEEMTQEWKEALAQQHQVEDKKVAKEINKQDLE